MPLDARKMKVKRHPIFCVLLEKFIFALYRKMPLGKSNWTTKHKGKENIANFFKNLAQEYKSKETIESEITESAETAITENVCEVVQSHDSGDISSAACSPTTNEEIIVVKKQQKCSRKCVKKVSHKFVLVNMN